ncbi:hypothetical protein HYPSUDRAFT_1074286 [Hypholoma sublateritium FD-334 SS-4]|uniref:Acyl-CoA oxidase C-alpha1 domain-containing protein n=1 Tax=Hypholoma sublateritium (strain FD-334 SS-4) TaxID=945553 RepID=A0A0D2P7Z9_HYPSF|nr:hypothetical protein HYPSUDRAFT_1074286 [Hypholoma sublateritium FD-334 SS-4]
MYQPKSCLPAYPADASMSILSSGLAPTPLFQDIDKAARLPHAERIQLTYKRLIAIGQAHRLTADDIMHTTPAYWALQLDPILTMDGAAATLMTIHLNLCTGTLARRAVGRPDLQFVLDKLLNFEIIQRRRVTDAFTGRQTPIIAFPTQQYPVLAALAQAVVFESLTQKAIALFTDKDKGLGVRHCIAAVAKVTLVKHCLASLTSLGDRCGAQGIFEVNQFSVLYADIRGASIAEGDLLGISVHSILAQRVTSMFQEIRDVLSTRFKHHRDPGFQAYVLPLCQPLIEAIGYSMAYDAAVEDGIDAAIVDMFVASVVRDDRAWFSEVGGISRTQQMDLERKAMQALLPRLDDLVSGRGVEVYCTAPIISDEKWKKYVHGLPTFTSKIESPDAQSLLQARAML